MRNSFKEMEMLIQQFEDKGLSHYSYAVLSEGEIALIDPARDPAPYYAFAAQHRARITAVLETHSHADFVSSHREVAAETGAPVFVSESMKAAFPHTAVREGDRLKLGRVSFRVLYTPGHSFDSVCFLLEGPDGKEHALFSGDTLFIGDVGRPDLRENIQDDPATRETLALAMYRTIMEKLRELNDDILVYPAHGAGTLCGKSLSEASSSTIGAERAGNYAFRIREKDVFVKVLLEEQPFVPKYFSYDVELNRRGAPALGEALQKIPRLESHRSFEEGIPVIDARPKDQFRENHLKGAFNIQDGLKFETWLGSVLGPGEKFYLIAGSSEQVGTLLRKIAKIGYEGNIAGTLAGLSGKHETAGGDLPA
ncbi:MAG TPA: MBL fold metallo-hydrolase, partial [Anseongella sp.]|nr:MBL fold metallo-hydrolase [Anseongella sp.]